VAKSLNNKETAMRSRPIRSQIYLPVVRFGVVDTDWKVRDFHHAALLQHSFLFNLHILNFPLEIWATSIGLVLSVAFFNFVRMDGGRSGCNIRVAALTKPTRQRHALPTDRNLRLGY